MMKKWFSLLLALMLCLTSITGGLAEAALTDGDLFDEAVVSAAPEEQAVDPLPEFELTEDDALEQAPEAAGAATGTDVPYAGVIADGAPCLAPDGSAVALLPAGSVVLLLDAGAQRSSVAFCTPSGVVEGTVAAEAVAVLSASEYEQLLNRLAASGEAVPYHGDLDRLLPFIDIAPPESAGGDDSRQDGEEALNSQGEAEAEAESNAGSESDAEPELNDGAEPAISVSAASVAIGVKESYKRLTARAVNADGSEASGVALAWKTSNAKVVKVSATGILTGVKKGSAVITVSAEGYGSRDVQVTVGAAPSKLTVEPKALSLIIGESASLACKPNGSAVSGAYTFVSSNTAVATVDGAGNVTAVSKGTATVTAKTYNGKKASCKVSVFGTPACIRVGETVSIAVGQTKAIDVAALDADGDVTPARLTCAVTEGNAAVDLDAGALKVTGKAKGSAVVAFSCGELTASCRVNVVNAPARIEFNQTGVEIGLKETYRNLSLRMIPAEGEESCAAVVVWTTSNKKTVQIVSSNETGCVLAGLKTGTATVSATTHNGKTASVTVTVRKAPSKLTTSPASLSLIVGSTAPLTIVPGKNTASGAYTYASDNEAVATVSADGVVKAIAKGSAKITAKAFNGKKASCKVTVYGTPAGISLGSESIDIIAGQTLSPGIAVVDADGAETLGSFAASIDGDSPDPECARVDAETGDITGLSRGSAIVVYTLESGASARCTVHVVSAPEQISTNSAAIEIGVKEAYKGVSLQMTPPEGDERCAAIVTWKTSNAKVAKVVKTGDTSCTIAGVKAGKATITATTHNGKTASIAVTVKKAPKKVTVTPAKLDISVGATETVAAAVARGTASGTFSFSSSNPEVASVSADGTVTGVAPGSAVIYAKAFNGKQGKCAVTVHTPPVRIEMDSDTVSLAEGLKAKLSPTALDAGAHTTYARFTYQSSAPDIAKVDAASGEITAVARGQATVTVTALDGAIRAECAVHVVAAPADMQFNFQEVTIGVGENYEKLACTLTAPEGETECATDITWKSSNGKVVKVKGTGLTATLTGVKAGTATITATTHNNIARTMKVKVLAAPKKLNLSPETLMLAVGHQGQLTASTGANTASGTLSFNSSDDTIATVDGSGKVTAIGKGTATVTASTFNGHTAASTVKVSGAPAQVFITEKLTLAAGMAGPVTASTVDADGDETTAEYTFTAVNDTATISVDASGTVKAFTPGIAYVKVKTDNDISTHIDPESGDTVETVCEVTVLDPPASLKIPETLEIEINETYTLQPEVRDENGNVLPVCTISYSIDSGTSATVSESGVITGLDVGYTTVVARTYNGFSATCKVLVKRRYRMFAAYSFFQTGTSGDLPFTQNNATSVIKTLGKSSIYGMKYEKVGLMKNPSKNSLLSGIISGFADSKDTDVSVVYLCSHGFNNIDGRATASKLRYGLQLPGYDMNDPSTYITSQEIFNAVNTIRGKVILILDSCYSGCFIDNMSASLKAEGGRITVMTAASNTKASYYNVRNTSVACDFFTFFLLEGAGYDEKEGQFSNQLFADANGDNRLTVNELFRSAHNRLRDHIGDYSQYSWFHGDKNQTPRIYAGSNGNLVLYQKE